MINLLKMAVTVAAIGGAVLASTPPNTAATHMPRSSALPAPTPRSTPVALGGKTRQWLRPTAQRHANVESDLARSLATADLTGDSTADIVTGNELSLTVGVMLSDRKGRMSEMVHYPISSALEASLYRVEVAVGNVVGNQYPDIVAAGFSRDVLEVFIGQSRGRFGTPIRVKLGAGHEPTSVAIGDMNRDGHQDIVTGDGLDQAVSVIMGDGKDGFSPPVRFPTGAIAGRVVVADATGDGRLDILSAGFDAGISLLEGNGRGSFAAPELLSAGANARVLGLAVTDATGDGHVDLVTANEAMGDDYNSPGSVSLLSGNGKGQFGAAQQLQFGKGTVGRAESVAVADITGDGHPDIVAGRPVDGSLTLLAGDGGRGFASPVDIPGAGGSPDPIAIADVTGDRRPDIIANVSIGQQEMVSILPSTGKGQVGFRGNFDTDLQLHAESMLGVDVNGDGRPDVVTVGVTTDWKAKVSVQLGDGVGGLSNPRHFGLNADAATGIASGDANSDGAPDVMIVTQSGGNNGVSILLGDGHGGFSDPHHHRIELNSQAPYAIAVADIDSDGHVDIATSNVPYSCLPGDPSCSPPDLGSVSVLSGDGRGSFSHKAQIEGVAAFPRAITAADATGDGVLDLVVPHDGVEGSGLRLLVGNGSGGFGKPVHLSTDFGPVAVAVVDATGDKRPDLISLNHSAQSISMLAGTGGGSFQAAVHFPLYMDEDVVTCDPGCAWLWPWAWALTVADMDGDGSPDIASANTNNGTLTVLRNNRLGSFNAVERIHTGGSPRALAAADFTGDGKVDVVAANAQGVVSVHANVR